MKSKILITGFKPFDTAETNPSWDVAQRAAALNLPYADIVCEEIQVLWHDAEVLENGNKVWSKSTWNMIQDAVKKHQPDCLISIGQGPYATMECTGRNEAIKYFDNAAKYYVENQDGEVPLEKEIVEPIPTTLPDKWLLENLKGLKRSDDAEGYLCNLALYMSLRHLTNIPYRGFFHTNNDEGSKEIVVLAIQMIAERLYGQSA